MAPKFFWISSGFLQRCNFCYFPGFWEVLIFKACVVFIPIQSSQCQNAGTGIIYGHFSGATWRYLELNSIDSCMMHTGRLIYMNHGATAAYLLLLSITRHSYIWMCLDKLHEGRDRGEVTICIRLKRNVQQLSTGALQSVVCFAAIPQ